MPEDFAPLAKPQSGPLSPRAGPVRPPERKCLLIPMTGSTFVLFKLYLFNSLELNVGCLRRGTMKGSIRHRSPPRDLTPQALRQAYGEGAIESRRQARIHFKQIL
jgi:hypothetical protein